MAVIIGAGTTVVSSQFPNGGIVSVQFGFNPEVERLYELGSFTPYDTTVTRTSTLSIVVYGKKADGTGGSLQYSIPPSTTCVDADAVAITVNPASCVSSLLPFAYNYFLTGYSYQKDNLGFGQETWSFTSKPIIDNYGGTIVMLRGIAEGTIATGPGIMTALNMGVVVDETASNDSLGAEIEGESGSVQAGPTATGEYNIERYIIATAVGASLGRGVGADGYSGDASVTIPMTPVYI